MDQAEGHGHVTPRGDGRLFRCGGPATCPACAGEAAAKLSEQAAALGLVVVTQAQAGAVRAAAAAAAAGELRRLLPGVSLVAAAKMAAHILGSAPWPAGLG